MTRPMVIIPVHNRRAITLACLERLAVNGDLGRFEVLVIDDGSTDGTSEEIARRHPEVAIDRGDGSLFWGGAIAAGMRAALTAGPRTLFWLNDDCLPRPGALLGLASALEADPGAILVPRCVVAETGAAWPNGFVGRQRVAGHPGETLQLDGASGYCAGIGLAVAGALGPVDAIRFPHYYADTEYTLRARKSGFAVRLFGSAEAELVNPKGELHRIADHIAPRAGLAANARRLFFSAKSPFRLGTLFNLQRLKHGPALGTLFASGKAAAWGGVLLVNRLSKSAPKRATSPRR